ncbi:MAG: AmmeMemoRadiSam system protein B [Planctomycetes bacterium]|nr:AmmeMemoRadiSam system protein B [Planctomycetota bacterium]
MSARGERRGSLFGNHPIIHPSTHPRLPPGEPLDKPKLRPIEALPLRRQGRVVVQLHDPARISDRVLIVPQETLFLLSLLDGTNSVVDIQAALLRQFGELVFSDKIQEVVQQLDDALFLDSSHFRAHLAKAAEEFRQSPVRLPSSAGSAYPADPRELSTQLTGLLTAEGSSSLKSEIGNRKSQIANPVVALIAPHIDFARGGPSYAHAYRVLAQDSAADLFVILGTAHQAQDALFILTRKSFQTPLGTLPTNADLVEALARRYGRDPFAEELVHRNEHSIEFQAVWLQHVLGGRQAEMLPVLCGSMERAVGDERSPREVPEIADFFDALREAVAASGRRTCAIAAADLSHVGRQFGDDYELTPQVLEDVESADRAMLAHVVALAPDAFYDSVRGEGNARHICGVPPIYALLATTDATSCTLLDYRQAADYPLQRAVTFASLALHRGPATARAGD